MEHLGTWTRDGATVSYRLDLWDTGRTDSRGSSTLHYALAMIPDPPSDTCRRVVIFEGEDFNPSPLHAIDSDETAGALIGFFAHYAESIHYSGDDAEVPELTSAQRDALDREGDRLGIWSYELENPEDL